MDFSIVIGIPRQWRIRLVDVYIVEPELPFIPHLESNGKICLFDLEASVIDWDLFGILNQCIERAKDIIELGIQNANSNDFIDEFDSNLHDVYLCALLEYLMEYGEGQLCFTTHNVGPMDVLKQHKKSIDFLSEDHQIYPWKTNGNYSPSKLYRNGMIEGSPFNVDAIDFIGVFGTGEEDTKRHEIQNTKINGII